MDEIVKTIGENVFAESQIVAPRFNKTHGDTLRKIESLIKDLTTHKCVVRNYFIKGEFTNSRNRKYENYLMTRDGFSMLAMSFEGGPAMKFKVEFIEAFKMMEQELQRQKNVRSIGIEVRKTMTDKIKETGENERMHGHGYSSYTNLAYSTIGIKYIKPKKGERFRDSLDVKDLERLETVEGMIKEMLKAGKEYGEIKGFISNIFGNAKYLQ